jgi:2,4-dienoyl-CoA reductase-like NADH-dependent reductase (Old Yellow Enzyme family)
MYDGIAFEEDPASRRPGLKGSGRACPFKIPYLWGWGVDESDPLAADPAEPLKLIGMLGEKGVAMFNLTAGSPYSSPHLSRPTETPPADADAYQPPRDPLHEVALHFSLVRAVKEAHPGVAVVGTGYSYLRQFKAHAADFNVREGRADVAGLGRALLAYPDEIRRILEEGEARQERGRVICTGDSACTTGPRFGLKSGCVYDPYYADVNREIAGRLAAMGLNKK